MYARHLPKGGTIGIISPCAIPSCKEAIDKAVSALQLLGFNVKLGRNLYCADYGYSASEAQRAADFMDMIYDEAVSMILFSGGNVSNELLPLLDYAAIAQHPKIICSFSDGTTLLDVIYSRTGLVTYYGQSTQTFVELNEYNERQFTSSFTRTDAKYLPAADTRTVLSHGSCEGTLLGGYSENFALLLGNKYFTYPKAQKYLLFIEDHAKYHPAAHVSSLLSHIEQSDIMDKTVGLLFGNYQDTPCRDLMDKLKRLGLKHNIPVMYCNDFGHGTYNAILPIGCTARMDTSKKTLEFTQAIIE